MIARELPMLPPGPTPVALLPAPQVESPEMDVLLWLTAQLEDDPTFDMALAYLLFDPLVQYYGKTADDVDGDEFGALLYIARCHFHDLYADFVELFWSLPEGEAYPLMANAMRDVAPDCGWVEFHPSYVPTSAVGIEVDNEAFWEHEGETLRPDLIEVLKIFGITVEKIGRDVRVTDTDRGEKRYDACAVLIESLKQQNDVRLHNIAMLLHWLFVETGYVLFDMTDETLWEWGTEPMLWEDHIEAWQVQDDVQSWLDMAMAAVELLEAGFVLLNALASNYRMVQTSLLSQPSVRTVSVEEIANGLNNPNQWAIVWPEPACEGNTGRTTAQCYPQTLRLWRDTGNPDFPLSD